MSAIAVATTRRREPRPSFLGCVGSEVLKLRRQAMVWAMLGLALLFFAVITAALVTNDGLRVSLAQQPATFVFNVYTIYGTIFATGSGIVLLILTARLVGMEYGAGTIRVLLARGAGRLRLLLAKLTAMALLALALLAGFLVLTGISVGAAVLSWQGTLDHVRSVPHAGTDLAILLLLALVSMGVCILIGAAAAVLGRSVAFGIGAALALFPIDNAADRILLILNLITHWHVWLDASAYLLGPNLNVLTVLMQTDHVARAAFAAPLVPVDATHAWLVVAAWSLGLAALAIGLTWRRDVLQ
jgi:ABC-type transport system involved in multi-copper enzyme maturation permease subunit